MSKRKNTILGVPLGTILGLTSFVLDKNYIVSAVKKFMVKLFEDDTFIYIIGDRVYQIIHACKEELSNVFQ